MAKKRGFVLWLEEIDKYYNVVTEGPRDDKGRRVHGLVIHSKRNEPDSEARRIEAMVIDDHDPDPFWRETPYLTEVSRQEAKILLQRGGRTFGCERD